jgi:hypothetical protein
MRANVLRLLCLGLTLSTLLAISPADAAPFDAKTRVRIVDSFWEINGKPTHPDSDCEGLLMNIRVVNATFDDRNEKTRPKGFDPDKNTAKFLAKLRDYVAHGVRGITLNLQGGMPGYEKALNSAFNPDGSLREKDMARVARVIEACDRLGVVVILGYFYQRQDQVLKDEAAVKRGVVEATRWIVARRYTNVVIEIANEHAHAGFDHKIIRDADGCASLVTLAKKTGSGILVSASGMGNGRVAYELGNASDFLLPHFNTTPVTRIAQMVVKLGKQSKAIVCNEDDKTGEEAAKALQVCVDNLCSWGYTNAKTNQHWPFEWKGAADDPIVYAKLVALTKPAR